MRERDDSQEGEWKHELCVCERQRGEGVCLIGKQMNNVSLGWRRKGDRKKCCVYRRERESNFSGMCHMKRHIGCVRGSHREKDKVNVEW